VCSIFTARYISRDWHVRSEDTVLTYVGRVRDGGDNYCSACVGPALAVSLQ